MKTLAELKRSIHVGSLLKMVRHDWFVNNAMTVHSNVGVKQLKGRDLVGRVRPVVLVQSNQIALTIPTDLGNGCWASSGNSYLTWPKAKAIRFYNTTDSNGHPVEGFEIDLNGDGTFNKIMAYEDVTYKADSRCECGAAYNVATGGYACAR